MSNPRRANGQRRDKLRRRVLSEESDCWLCGQPVDLTLPHGLPGSPELDEVVPVSRGGDPFARANVRLAHRIRLCNQRRGNRDPDSISEPRPPVVAFESSRRWKIAP